MLSSYIVSPNFLQNDGIEAFKFYASLMGGEMPINALLISIAFGFPSKQFFRAG
jgi:hypothetical protein